MFTENGVLVDLEEVSEVVDSSDVFTIGFRVFPQRVVIDTRETGDAGPMVRVVEPVDTVEERFHWLGRERPAFEAPKRFTFFVWPHSLQFFESSGLPQRVRDRLRASERPQTARMVNEALEELRRLEREAVQQALSGDGYHTLWPQT